MFRVVASPQKDITSECKLTAWATIIYLSSQINDKREKKMNMGNANSAILLD